MIFLSPDLPSDWLPVCFAGLRKTAFQAFGEGDRATLLLGPTSKLLTAAVGGAEEEAGDYRGSLNPLGTQNSPMCSVSSEPDFQGHTYPE